MVSRAHARRLETLPSSLHETRQFRHVARAMYAPTKPAPPPGVRVAALTNAVLTPRNLCPAAFYPAETVAGAVVLLGGLRIDGAILGRRGLGCSRGLVVGRFLVLRQLRPGGRCGAMTNGWMDGHWLMVALVMEQRNDGKGLPYQQWDHPKMHHPHIGIGAISERERWWLKTFSALAKTSVRFDIRSVCHRKNRSLQHESSGGISLLGQ